MDEEKEHPNHTIRNSVYNNFESLSASALKVFWKLFRLRMQATELRDGRRTSVNNHSIVRQVLSKSLTPSDLYSFCQPRSPLQHNLPNSACVHNCHKYTSTSPFSTSLLSPSMSLYSKSESVPTFQHSNILHDEESCLASFWRSARLESMGVNFNICLQHMFSRVISQLYFIASEMLHIMQHILFSGAQLFLL